MIDRLAILGATGDLSARFLLPALAALRAAGHTGDALRVTGASREDWDTGRYRAWAAERLDRHGGALPAGAGEAVVSALDYRRADVTDRKSVV